MKWFNNLRVKSKLLISFAIAVAFSIALAIVAVVTVNRIDNSYTYLLDFPQQRLEFLMQLNTNCSDMRRITTAIMLNEGDKEVIDNYWKQFEQAHNEALDNMDKYLNSNNTDTVRDPAVLSANNATMQDLKKQLESYKTQASLGTDTARSNGSFASANAIFLAGAPMIGEVTSSVGELIPKAAAYVGEVSAANTQEKNSAIRLLIILLAIVIILSVVIAFYISGLIAKPLGIIAKVLEQIGTTGNLKMEKAAAEATFSKQKDEIGTCARAVNGLIEHLEEVEETLARVSDGDLTVTVNTLSDQDAIGQSVSKMVDSLNSMFAEINSASAQVTIGSKQIADGAQSLAQGSTEQASAVQQLSASISEIAEKTKENANMATRAADLAQTIMGNAEKGSQQMDQMMTAVKEINQASQNISKVIKVIDDIAFQTNILALNAAVEAARAGQHGKGFAVVAEEVRSLAAKSAEAAKETGGLIASSMEKAELGSRIAGETSVSLSGIVSGINESNKIVGDIAKSSEEQALAITQVNTGIDQVAQVVQQNSATAEQSAAASEEMSGQSNTLEELIAQFKLKEAGMTGRSLPSASFKRLGAAEKANYTPENSSGNFGKY